MDGDLFKWMWDEQLKFMRLLQEKRGAGEFPVDITSKTGQKALKDLTHHVMDELFESSQHLKNSKSHRATLVPEVDLEAYTEELVDALKFFLGLVITSGISIDDFISAFAKKTNTNKERIENGY